MSEAWASIEQTHGANARLRRTLADDGTLHVLRHLRYSLHNENCLGLGLLLNGIPVATCEITTDYTQVVDDAVLQYRKDRPPCVARSNAVEPLLAFPQSALVHFALSNSAVRMTTKLNGFDTVFLPFDMGDAGAAGNPPNPQLDATRAVVAAVRRDGPSEKYLIQRSAGSGKTNSIAWTAHYLADCTTRTTARCSTRSWWCPTVPCSMASCRKPSWASSAPRAWSRW